MPHPSLRIALAEDDPAAAYTLSRDLRTLGHELLYVARSGAELIEKVRAKPPDLVLADVRLSDGDGIDASEAVYRERPVPIVLASAYFEPETIARAERGHVLGYLVKPIQSLHLIAALAVALRCFATIEGLQKEADQLRHALDERKLVERAKGVVMRILSVDEETAHRSMRKYASDRNLKVLDVASRILAAEEPFRELRNIKV